MDNHGDFSSLERSRLFRAALDAGGGGGAGGAGGGGSHPVTAGDMVPGRSASPTTLTLAQYQSRYGLPSALPGSNLAVMSSLFSGAHSSEARKAFLVDVQQYWTTQADNFPHYLMAGGLYPPYPPILPGAAESLSLLGAGVACVASSTAAGASHTQHIAQYQRLLEMQKEAYLVSMSASHPSALYGLSASALPPFLSHAQYAPPANPPFSLVKQEPREPSTSDKSAKPGERRTGGLKLDLEGSRPGKDASSLLGHNQSLILKEPKLSPSAQHSGASSRTDKRSCSSSSSPGGSSSHPNSAKKSTSHAPSTSNSTAAQRLVSDSARTKCTSPTHRSSNPPLASPRSSHSSGSKKSTSKSSPSVAKQLKISTSMVTASTSHPPALSASFTVQLTESPVVSVPTQAAAPIPLATVQHDGVLLSALASPSSAAASLVSTKPTIIKQHPERLNRYVPQDRESGDISASLATGTNASCGLSCPRTNQAGPSCDHESATSPSGEESTRVMSASHSVSISSDSLVEPADVSASANEDSSDIIVDSTEKDDLLTEPRSPALSGSARTTAADEAVEEGTSMVDSVAESDSEETRPELEAGGSKDTANIMTRLSLSKIENSCVVTSLGLSSSTRTIYAKTQPVPSVTISGCIQMSSSITSQASSSALPYYHTLYSKPLPPGPRRVHATTFVPEVGTFKGPSLKAMSKTSSSPGSSLDTRARLDPRAVCSLSLTTGSCGSRELSPSPSLLSPCRELLYHSTTSHSPASPGLAHTTTETNSSLDSASLDSASVRSHSVASCPLAAEADEDSDDSSDKESSLVIDQETFDKTQGSEDELDDDGPLTEIQKLTSPSDHTDSIRTRILLGRRKSEVAEEEPASSRTQSSTVVSDKDTCLRKVGRIERGLSCEITVPVYPPPAKSQDNQEVHLLPSARGDKSCCEVAIDYSLPKSSWSGLNPMLTSLGPGGFPLRASISSQPNITALKLCSDSSRLVSLPATASPSYKELEQTVPKAHSNLPKTHSRLSTPNYPSDPCTKLINSLSKPLMRHDLSGSAPGKVPIALRRSNRSSDQLKPTMVVGAPLLLSKTGRRAQPRKEDLGDKRCESAPPVASPAYVKSLKSHTLAASEGWTPKEAAEPDKLEGSIEHTVGCSNNIPVGIAVAQIRPHHIHQPKETQTIDSLNRETRNLHQSVRTENMGQVTASLATPTASLAPGLVVAGRTINPSPWIQQLPFPLHQASGAAFDPSFPISAPNGFQFAQDSLTGHFFLVPTGEFVDQRGVWSAAGVAPTLASLKKHFTSSVDLPSVALNGQEVGDWPKTENTAHMETDSEHTTHTFLTEHETEDKEGLVRGHEKHSMGQSHPAGQTPHHPVLGLLTASSTSGLASHPAGLSPPPSFKEEQPSYESRGCSPIVFDSSPQSPCQSEHTPPSAASNNSMTTCTVGVQTCDDLMKSACLQSAPKQTSHDQCVQTACPEFPTLNPLSVHCPDLDAIDSLPHSLETKTTSGRTCYNPFTDPQILQAADGLELLSTLAEKRTKCSSVDDPKRIFPSPSDSFKSDSASILAMEDTLSPGDVELRSGQCTPRRDVRRDLSPKWSLAKKEAPVISLFADFKAPTEVDMPDDSEVRVKLAEVQRQYKEKQKELARLQSKKSDSEGKTSKRGPGRPPKKKSSSKRSDDDSSSMSPKPKDLQLQPVQKKKRPAEELVDRVFRKLPPVIKPTMKASRSIHYVKSKTGPFFRRKSASSSLKKNKDLFGFDESNWPSFSERKHQEKIQGISSFSERKHPDKIQGISSFSESKHQEKIHGISSFSERKHQEKIHRISSFSERKHQDKMQNTSSFLDIGNIFTNLENLGGEYSKRRSLGSTHHRHTVQHSSSTVKTEPCLVSCHQESGLGLLAKFALTVSTASQSSPSVSVLFTSSSASSVVTATGSQSSITSSFATSSSMHGGIYTSSSGSIYTPSGGNSHYMPSGGSAHYMPSGGSAHYMPSGGSSHYMPSITFGCLGSFMSSPSSGLMSFTSPTLGATSLSCSTPSSTVFAPVCSVLVSPTSTLSVSVMATSPLFPSPGVQHPSSEESCSNMSNGTSVASLASLHYGTTASSNTSGSLASIRDVSPFKRKHDEGDSDTDTSDTSPNKKRKPGRPRKTNPEKSCVGTETIWAKKSNSMGLLQVSESSSVQTREGCCKKDSMSMKPLFLDEEWTRRRSERIFLNEPSPLPSPALSPSPRAEPVWKLSNFIPKSKKSLDPSKGSKDGSDKDKSRLEPCSDQPAPTCSRTSQLSTPPATQSSTTTYKSEAKDSAITNTNTSWSTSTRTTEISTPKVEDAKIIVKLEDALIKNPLLSSAPSTPASTPSSTPTFKSDQERDLSQKKPNKKKLSTSSSSITLPSSTVMLPLSSVLLPSSSVLLASSSVTLLSTSVTLPSTPSPPLLEKKEKRAEEHSKIKLQKAKSLHDLTQKVKKKYSKNSIRKQKEDQAREHRNPKKRKASTESSDTDNLPLAAYREDPPTPEPRSCKLQPSDLREGLKVLYLIDGLFHEGTVKALQPPDVYGVLTAGQRGNRPHILCLEEILKWAVLDVRPGSVRYLSEGTRICAFWSQQFSCLYPGTVAKSSPSYNGKKVVIPVEFDDGDNGRIELDHIRLLPADFPIVEYEPDPLEVLPRRKQRSSSEASETRKSQEKDTRRSLEKDTRKSLEKDTRKSLEKDTRRSLEKDTRSLEKDTRRSQEKGSKGGQTSKAVEDDDQEQEDDDTADRESKPDSDSDDSGGAVRRESWKWGNRSTKRPSLKGKAKKVFYSGICRGSENIQVGDSAVFVSRDRADCPYIGRVDSLWQGWNGQMMVKVQWYYHPEETQSNKKLADPRNALFESHHEDDNDVQTIAYKCQVLPYAKYKRRLSDATKKGEQLKPNIFYLAGFYEPTAKNITFYQGVS